MLKAMSYYGIGQTPILNLAPINGNRVLLKMESKNFLGSVKARTAYGLVKGLQVPRKRIIIESTSGNLGLALNFFCREEERPFLCLLDETVIAAKLEYLKEQGVDYEIVPTLNGMDGRSSRMKRAEELTKQGHHFWVNQYDNEDGIKVHQQTTGIEIIGQTQGNVTCVFCAVGSGGTIIGIGECFKSLRINATVFGVEPYGSTIFSVEDKPYITAGAGLRGQPGNIKRHPEIVGRSTTIHDDISVNKCNELYTRYNADVGITTGMAYAAAEQYCHATTGETVVIIAADGREMYHDYL